MPLGIYPRTKEHNNNIKKALSGKKLSKSHIESLKNAWKIRKEKGWVNPTKGKKFSKEHREKLSIAHKGQIAWNKGRIFRKGIFKHSEYSKKKIALARIGTGNGNWGGGRWKAKNGYVLVKSYNHPYRRSQDYVLEHRLVMEQHLGRHLTCKEVVHHINGIKDDNRIKNLILMNHGEHTRYHWIGKKRNKKRGKMINNNSYQ